MADKEEILKGMMQLDSINFPNIEHWDFYHPVMEAMEEYKNQECEEKDTSYQRLTDQFELLAGKVIKKNKEIVEWKGNLEKCNTYCNHLEENWTCQKSVDEIERLKGLIKKAFNESREYKEHGKMAGCAFLYDNYTDFKKENNL